MGQKILLEIPEKLYKNLSEIAKNKGKSLEDLAIQCLSQLEHNIVKDDPLAEFIGAFDSKNSDWLDNHDSYIGESIVDFHESK